MTEEEMREIAREVAQSLRDDPSGWEILAALGPLTVLAGAVVLWVGLASVKRQRLNTEKQSEDNGKALDARRKADDRAEWWKRVQWALDASLGVELRRQSLGFEMLERLTQEEGIDTRDLKLLDAAWQPTPAADETSAESALADVERAMQDFTDQGLVDEDYLAAYQRVMDENARGEHNGNDTSNGEGR